MEIELNIRAVERRAKVGEYILITGSDDGAYDNGTVFEVIAEDYWGDGSGVGVTLSDGDEHGVFHEEYHVLEMEGLK